MKGRKGQDLGLRQSMSWLHGWSGLLLGWLLFAIFFTGTIAYFRQEVTAWMQPETAASRPSPQAAELAIAKLAAVAPDAASWRISLPNDRSNTLGISWRKAQPETRARGGNGRGERGGEGNRNRGRRGGGRDRGESLTLDATTGATITPRETAGGTFLYRFHFELYALPREWARWIVGIATMAMFVAIISGVITHKKIFKDFFTFRPAKGQRSWLDAHNATAVLALPFHLMITYSGLLLFASTLLPWAGDMAFGEDPRASRAEARAAQAREVEALQARLADAAGTDPAMAPIAPMLARAERIWGQPASRITITDPGKPGALVEVLPTRNDSLAQHSGSGGLGAVKLRFAGATGALIDEQRDAPGSAIATIDTALGSLHRARFAPPGLRWLFFLAGVGGTVMVGSGLVLWSVKRAEKRKGAPGHFGHKLVDHLNVGAVAGLCIATAGYFWANRLLPARLDDRGEWEIACFLAIWLASFVHPLLRPLRAAWLEQLTAAGALFAALPVLNLMTSHAHLGVTVPAGNWMVAGFDLVALATGLALLAAAAKLRRRIARAASKPPVATHAARLAAE
ncbi:hypothetical protein B2G71_04985 [Novosphingobium sp. PC22D]|uniref:PepSY-associated TM helix domain-containing protein n=1 Tax=Novosphingobium sp. PC22D TaxID=1962403 RepID=UPI000BFAD165|nr:PepSY-associated TM helix domain-containing protein [Novosphingobium sp. PC22D]PEQ13679.1 hypothetical protein B2G71_04985 [Novosphingobium sp. PC22D]